MKQTGLHAADGAAVPLRGVDITGELLGAHARVTVRQRYLNTEARAIEAVYTFPLPSEAALVGFAMNVAGRRIDAVVREREAAFRTYDDAIVQGHGAALLEKQRDEVFTATAGNLLPGESVDVEVSYLQRLHRDEGALRWVIPTLVAPRYIPGTPHGDRTGHGTSAPTDRVADADLVTPPIGDARYGLTLDLALHLGRALRVESPSHDLAVEHDERTAHVKLAATSVALDRDVVVIARGVGDGPTAGLVAHCEGQGRGFFSLGVLPDLFDAERALAPRSVVFVLDESASMEGPSIREARKTLRACLRHLRAGDRFNIVAFSGHASWFERRLVPFTPATVEAADRWVISRQADGGTDLLAPLVAAVEMVPDGVVVMLTDGQVGNESELVGAVMAARRTTRVCAFGLGTNICEGLLRDLARRTSGEVEFVHPGEKVDAKVTAMFARVAAARVTGVRVVFEGVAASELAPGSAPDLVDGEPWSVFGRYEGAGEGFALITGTRGTEPYLLEVPVRFPAEASQPALPKLWAAERVRDLEGAAITDPRRASAMKARVVAIAVEHGVASRHTSFVLVEERTGDRVGNAAPETRVVPVSAPAGWAMHTSPVKSGIARWDPVARVVVYESVGASSSMRCPPPRRTGAWVEVKVSAGRPGSSMARPMVAGRSMAAAPPPAQGVVEAWKALLQAQLTGDNGDDVARMRSMAEALSTLVREGVTATHPTYGPQMRKAVAALVSLVAGGLGSPALAAWALAACALAADGERAALAVEQAAAARGSLPGFTAVASDPAALRRELYALGKAAAA